MTKPAIVKKRSIFSLYIFLLLFILIVQSFEKSAQSIAQIAYQNVSNKQISIGSYGRVGVDWSFEDGAQIGRRLNLNNMGSIGGRLEEQDYLEIAPAFHFNPKPGDNTQIFAQVRLSVYSTSLTSFGNSTSTSLGGLAFALPEAFVEARNINGKELSIWAGARLYRGSDVHIADHFYFNDHSGQGFGVEFKKTRFAFLFVSSTDTTSSVPPYFYLNIKTGTPNAGLRQRTIGIVEQDFVLNERNVLTALGEFHLMPDADVDLEIDSIEQVLNFPVDYGFVLGFQHQHDFQTDIPGSFNNLSMRYGSGIANGGDGGLSRTWLTYGAPDTATLSFNGAYSFALVNQLVYNFTNKYTLNGYVVMTASKGGADSDDKGVSYFGDELYNKRFDFTIGTRNEFYLTDFFHLIGELHYSQRTDGDNPMANMVKFSVAPIYVPTGERNIWARPHIRFVTSVSRYNDFAMETLYSPYLQAVGAKRWGYYFGVKAEWWVWN